MRSQARYGTSWKRAATELTRFCCLRTASRIEIGIRAAKNFRQKSEEIELHGQTISARGHQVGFERAEGALVGAAGFVAEFVPAGPPAGANHVEAGGMDEREIAVPDVDVGMIEEQALHFAGHIGGADDGEGFAIDGEVIGIDAERGAGAQESSSRIQKAE